MRHIISVLMENESGALSRVVGLFSARGYNIESLSVAPTDDDTLSRLTLVTTGSQQVIDQVIKQLNKLIEVVKVLDLSDCKHVSRELMFVKVESKNAEGVASIQQVTDIFRGKIVDLSKNIFTIEVTGQSDKLDAFIESMREQDIIEVVRSGSIGIARGDKALKV
ncbi:acetolactate synthase small subunit [Leucothrix arctica]|uniref:Acetolactate synthase small subunit n=1 Tax=Leucothrix arctica TaxID=1481894 RepID=A0A317CKQ5_9GAMM|nr:acetolactate synthase small subunit [Leucothrix arctica]PWQ98919.1 acetolactate synthase small subunit [Leucothrix arctica]